MSLRAPGKPVPVALQPLAFVGNTLTVPYSEQEEGNWCWAACGEMVFNYYNVAGTRQCDLASWLCGSDCCAAPSSHLCNTGASDAQIVAIYQHWSLNCSPPSSPLLFSQVQSEIDNRRPFEVAVQWWWGGGHVVIVCGWYTDDGWFNEETVRVNDPWLGPGVVKYLALLNAYYLMGAWRATFSNLRR
jgi:hypothetical protein